MKVTPDKIVELKPNEVFVFGSNYAGRHGRGAAKLAARKFGARYGTGTGLMGQSYGIATKGHRLEVLPLSAISVQIERFLRVAAKHPELEFLVTKIGCGLAGYSEDEIAPLFTGKIPPNVSLPAEFWKARSALKFGTQEFTAAVEAQRELAIKQQAPHANSSTKFTCENCRDALVCEYAFDGYNTDGDCLASK